MEQPATAKSLDSLLKVDYKEIIRRSHLYTMNPRSLITGSIAAATAWRIHHGNGASTLLTHPLASIFQVGIVSAVTHFFASTLSECIPNPHKPIVPVMLFGSAAFYVSTTYVGRPKHPHYKETEYKITFGGNKEKLTKMNFDETKNVQKE